MSAIDLPPHRLKIALLQPQIAPNTGNIARLCVATGTELHIVRPMGFVLSDRELKRSAMDYWDRLKLTLHDDTDAFFASAQSTGGTPWLFSTKGGTSLFDTPFRDGDWLLFGSETRGLSDALLTTHASTVVRIPQAENERCLNLSTAAGIGLYAALSRLFSGATR